jgi:hypothetical protein
MTFLKVVVFLSKEGSRISCNLELCFGFRRLYVAHDLDSKIYENSLQEASEHTDCSPSCSFPSKAGLQLVGRGLNFFA